jgi:hypothetical protein
MATLTIRRIVYAALIDAVPFGVVRFETTLDAITIETAILLLLAWCAIFLRVEPTLTRIALLVVLLSFWLTVAFRDSFMKHALFSPAATQCI